MSELDKRQYSDRPFFRPEQYIQMNLAFAHAMLEARKQGLEKFTLGVKKDDTPFVPVHFERVMDYSGMGSSAQSCIDESPSRPFSGSNGRHNRMDGGKAREW